MRKQLMIPFSLLAAVLILSLLSLSGCDPLEIQGTPITNIAARIYWAGIPSDSMVHSFNPMLYWYGNDEDGQINDYIYGIFQGAYMDSASRENSLVIPDTMAWISLGNVTEAVISLVASPDSSDTIGQYLVLRGIDDAGDSSNVLNRYLYRTNNRPTCIVTVPQGPQWVLPDTTSTWNGVNVSWEGKDSLDYTGAQPDFLWEVRIYGPFDSVAVDSLGLVNPDTSENTFVRYITDDDDSLRIAGTSTSLVDLRTGFYIVYVRNFDDANVSAVPALGVIQVFEPHWIPYPEEAKDILLAAHNSYQGQFYGELEAEHQDSVEQFYNEMVLAAGYSQSDYDWIDGVSSMVTLRNLYMYRMVIALDTDWRNIIATDQQEEYADYLDAGGMIWVIGRRSFNGIPDNQNVGFGTAGLPFTYLNLDGVYLNVSTQFDSVQFTGATPLLGELPQLDVDTLRVSYTSFPIYDYAEALFGVGFLMRLPQSEPLYTYDALNETSIYNGMPVAVRYETATFKTSYFCFPLYFIDEEAAFQTADVMLSWFLDE